MTERERVLKEFREFNDKLVTFSIKTWRRGYEGIEGNASEVPEFMELLTLFGNKKTELKKCENCKSNNTCDTYNDVKIINRKGSLRSIIGNEGMEKYNQLYANICHFYEEVK